MSIALGHAFVGFGAMQSLSALAVASEHRNEQNLLRQQQLQYDAQAQELTGQLEAHEAVQQELFEIQRVAIDALSEAIETTAEATQIIVEGLQDEQEAARKVAEAIDEKLGEVVSQLGLVLATWYSKANQSAGGVLGRPGETRDDLKGWPWATGDLKLTFNNAPRGWLVCDGTMRRRSEYPELGYLIGGKFGGGGDGNFFRLPTKAELTDDTKILALDSLQFCIRY